MAIRFKLGDIDAAKYKEGSDWFVYDSAKLRDMPARELIELETHLGGHSVAQIENDFFNRGGFLGMLGALYIARRLAGVVEAWENFDPLLNAITIERFVPGEDVTADPGDGDTAVDPTGPATSPGS